MPTCVFNPFKLKYSFDIFAIIEKKHKIGEGLLLKLNWIKGEKGIVSCILML